MHHEAGRPTLVATDCTALTTCVQFRHRGRCGLAARRIFRVAADGHLAPALGDSSRAGPVRFDADPRHRGAGCRRDGTPWATGSENRLRSQQNAPGRPLGRNKQLALLRILYAPIAPVFLT